MPILCARLSAIACTLLVLAGTVHAQVRTTTQEPPVTPTPSLEKRFVANILHDQRAIWTSPFNLRRNDGKWLAPLSAATVVLLATDRRTSGKLIEAGDHRTRLTISRDISYAGNGFATGGVAATFYFLGRARHDPRARETGLLAAEALLNSAIVAMALKTVSQRPRPTVDHASGEFFDGGRSFPSGHAISAWTLAAVLDQEYGRQRPLVRFGVYGMATAISLSRYAGTRHFLSDVLVGSALGYGIGRYVYQQHHDCSLDGANSGKKKKTITRSKFFPNLAPSYSRRGNAYGVTVRWGG